MDLPAVRFPQRSLSGWFLPGTPALPGLLGIEAEQLVTSRQHNSGARGLVGRRLEEAGALHTPGATRQPELHPRQHPVDGC